MSHEHEVIAQQVKEGVEKLLTGEMSREEYEVWLVKSNATLDALADKQRSAEFWRRYQETCYY
jgi:hypothetical protein